MANFIEKYNASNSSNFVSYTSRYINSQLYYYGNDRKITYETYKRKKENYSDTDQFFEVPKNLNYRPDILSSKYYGTPDYWWRILEYNMIFDIMDFKSGIIVRLPSKFNPVQNG